MITLYRFHWSHYVEKVRWALDSRAWSGARSTSTRSPSARCSICNCKTTLDSGKRLYTVPAIQDEATGNVVGESPEILEYPERTYPIPALYPVEATSERKSRDGWLGSIPTLGLAARRLAYTQIALEHPGFLGQLFAPETVGTDGDEAPKKKNMTSAAWQEAKALIWARRGRLGIGLALMLVNRLAGLVLPATSKFLIDDVIGKRQRGPAAAARAGGRRGDARPGRDVVRARRRSSASPRSARSPTCASASRRTSRACRSATSTRRKTGVLISRIMTDAEGIRNLVGTGLVQLVGGIVTAILALGVLFYLNWQLTLRSPSSCWRPSAA